MKFSAPCLALATTLLAIQIFPASSVGFLKGNQRSSTVDVSRRAAVGEACLSSFEAKVGTCDEAGLTAAVETALASTNCEHNTAFELNLLFSDSAAAASAACASPEDEPPKAFSEINMKGPLFDKEYMDGGTYFNQEQEYRDSTRCPTEVLGDDPGVRIERIHADVASSTPINLPEGSNFESCSLNAAMCCFVADRDGPMTSNTDVCYHDLRNSPGSNHVQMGYAIYGDDVAGTDVRAHCHGFAWDETSRKYAGNVLFEISMYENLSRQGRVRNVPGAPMCACMEQMPVVEEAACTDVNVGGPVFIFKYSAGQLSATRGYDLTFDQCKDGSAAGTDLAGYYNHKFAGGDTLPKFNKRLVGEGQCEDATKHFLFSQGLQYKSVASVA